MSAYSRDPYAARLPRRSQRNPKNTPNARHDKDRDDKNHHAKSDTLLASIAEKSARTIKSDVLPSMPVCFDDDTAAVSKCQSNNPCQSPVLVMKRADPSKIVENPSMDSIETLDFDESTLIENLDHPSEGANDNCTAPLGTTAKQDDVISTPNTHVLGTSSPGPAKSGANLIEEFFSESPPQTARIQYSNIPSCMPRLPTTRRLVTETNTHSRDLQPAFSHPRQHPAYDAVDVTWRSKELFHPDLPVRQQRRYHNSDWWNVELVRSRVSEKYTTSYTQTPIASVLYDKRRLPQPHPPMSTQPVRLAHRTQAWTALQPQLLSHDKRPVRPREKAAVDRDCSCDNPTEPACVPKVKGKRKKKKKRPKAAHHSRRSSIPSLPPINDKLDHSVKEKYDEADN